jgi:hypothetical protein
MTSFLDFRIHFWTSDAFHAIFRRTNSTHHVYAWVPSDRTQALCSEESRVTLPITLVIRTRTFLFFKCKWRSPSHSPLQHSMPKGIPTASTHIDLTCHTSQTCPPVPFINFVATYSAHQAPSHRICHLGLFDAVLRQARSWPLLFTFLLVVNTNGKTIITEETVHAAAWYPILFTDVNGLCVVVFHVWPIHLYSPTYQFRCQVHLEFITPQVLGEICVPHLRGQLSRLQLSDQNPLPN